MHSEIRVVDKLMGLFETFVRLWKETVSFIQVFLANVKCGLCPSVILIRHLRLNPLILILH